MTFWLLRGLQRRIVTTRYPTQSEPSTSALPTPPAFRPELLSRATVDAMVAICPSRALRRDVDTLVYDVGACTACERCLALAAPAGRPSGEFELAATSRESLVKRIPIMGSEPKEKGGTR